MMKIGIEEWESRWSQIATASQTFRSAVGCVPRTTDDGAWDASYLLPPQVVANEKVPVSSFSESGANKMQRGFSLVSAIFLLVVIAALGTFAVTLSTTQQQSAALDVTGARAYQAARAGIEWGAYQALTTGGVIACGALPATVANPVTMTGTTLVGFTVSVSCGSTVATEAGVPVTMYQLTSTATTTGLAVGNPNYVERQMTVTIAQ